MKRFVFRLETLLKVRVMEEEERQIQLSQAVKALQAEKEKETRLREAHADILLELKNKQETVLTIETLKNYHYFIDKLKEEVYVQTEKTARAAEYYRQCLKEFEEATKKRKLVDKLKEKQWLEYQEEYLKEEQNILDELGIRAYKNG